MTNKTFEKLNQELIKKGLVYDYEPCDGCGISEYQHLDAIYPWGYILTFDCDVLPTMFKLYDNEHQFICTLDRDDDNWSIANGYLKCERKNGFSNTVKRFSYNLNAGAPIHVGDVKALLLMIKEGRPFPEESIIIVDVDGKPAAYHKKDGEEIKNITKDALEICEYIKQGYTLIEEKYYKNHVDSFNDMLVTRC